MLGYSQLTHNAVNSFRWTAKGLSHTQTCVHSPPDPLPIRAAVWHWAELPVLYSRSLSVTHSKHSSVHTSIPSSLTIPSPALPPSSHSSFSKSVGLFLFCKFICVSLFRSHIGWMAYNVSPPVWLTSLSVTLCRSFVLWQMALFHSFMMVE